MIKNNKTGETQSIRYGGFWRRVMAYQFDLLLIYLISAFVWGWLYHITGIDIDLFNVLYEQHYLLVYTLLLVLPWLYFAGFHSSKWQATPGMWFLDMQVVNKDYERLSIIYASVRFFTSVIANIITLVPMLMLPSKQTFHDMWANSYVIIKSKKPLPV